MQARNDRLRILLVAPDSPERDRLGAGLGAKGYSVVETESEEAAWEAASAGRVDVALLDAATPEIDVAWLIRRLVEAPHVPIVALVDATDTPEAARLRGLGVADLAVKNRHSVGWIARSLEEAIAWQHRRIRGTPSNVTRTPPRSTDAKRLPRILIADDSSVARQALRGALTEAAHLQVEVDTVDNGLAAVAYGSRGSYALIFVDHVLGDITGLEVLGRLRSAGVQTPVVGMSFRNDDRLASLYRRAGAATFLHKQVLTSYGLAKLAGHVIQTKRVPQAFRSRVVARILGEAVAWPLEQGAGDEGATASDDA